ncbi:MAG: SMP-30/gluconolactonase/LRE family protein [Chloroflexota bacterium]|nr:SMP-30/gluconolactonase/LRE family protein [Chloroflexota bacterium]
MTPHVALDRLETFADGLDHPEGICLSPDGHLYVGGEKGQLYRIEDDDSFTELLRTDGFMLGLAADAEGRIYGCDTGHGCVWRIAPATGTVERWSDGNGTDRMAVPNWGCFDAAGNYYVSDSGRWKAAEGRIWVIRPGGRAEIWTAESRDFPNGMAVDPFQPRLLVLESTPGRLVEFPIRAGGSAGPRRVLAELPGTVPDGVAVAQDRSLIIACYRPDVIYRWTAGDGLSVIAEDPEGTVIAAPTNVCFTGPDLDVMVTPNIGRWHLTRIRAGIRGTPLFRPTAEQVR